MIKSNVALVLGAGASNPYGFPLGEELVRQIIKAFKNRGTKEWQLVAQAKGVWTQHVDDFTQLLIETRLNSIDAFLDGNEERYVTIGKRAIAVLIWKATTPFEDTLRDGKEFSNPDWYRYLWNLMKAPTAEGFRENNVAVVTFNYDMSFERYFKTVLRATYRLKNDQEALSLLRETIPIVHVHGLVDCDRRFQELDASRIQEAAKNIRVAHEPAQKDELVNAFNVLSSADKIAFMGFGYDAANVEQLKLNEVKLRSKTIYGTALGLGRAEMARVTRLIRGGDWLRNLDALTFLREVDVL